MKWNEIILNQVLGVDIKHVFEANKIVIDSREVTSKSIFIALQGERTHGHKFIQQVLDKNVSFIITDQPFNHPKVCCVESSLEALNKLAQYTRSLIINKPVIGITGSVGKTSLRTMMTSGFSKQLKVYSSIKNYNNHFGLPLCLVNVDLSSDVFIFELGMSNLYEISKLVQILKPTIGVISAIAAAHTKFLPTLDLVAKAKLEIIESSAMETLFYNIPPELNNLLLEKHDDYKHVKLVNLSLEQNINIISSKCIINNEVMQIKTLAKINNIEVNYSLNTFYPHNAFLAAITLLIAQELKYNLNNIIRGMLDFKVVKGRGDYNIANVNNKKYYIINDSYNASPLSVKSGLAALEKLVGKFNIVLVLGEMLELGELSQQYHKELIPYIKKLNPFMTVLVGECMSAVHEQLITDMPNTYFVQNDISKIDKLFTQYLLGNELIYVKGSNSINLSDILLIQSVYNM